MSVDATTGFAPINGAKLYYEFAGMGVPLVMIHAGIADHRQWNHEFAVFAPDYRVLRYDQRGFGQSEPVAGAYRTLDDLTALLDYLAIREPVILMGCSMGGGLALDMTIAHPDRVRALIMVDSGPDGLELDISDSPKFADAVQAYEAGDLDLTSEIEMQIWFDGVDRTPEQVNASARQLAYEMNRIALEHETKALGDVQPNITPPAATRLGDVTVPVLVIVGSHDVPYTQAAADYMLEALPNAQKVVIEDAAHLPNMEHPDAFQRSVAAFLATVEV